VTTLVVEELKTTLSQTFTLNNNRRYSLYAIKPHLYMHNAPAGTFTFKIKNGATELISVDFTSADIKSDLSTSDNYAHILKGLLLNSPVQLDGATSYTLELSASGYTYGTSSYMGWVKNHENIFFDIDGTPENDFNNPHTFFLYELRNI
jgi:hypothetical protein